MGADPGGMGGGHVPKHELSPPTKIPHIFQNWTNNDWQKYFWLHVPSLVSSTTMQIILSRSCPDTDEKSYTDEKLCRYRISSSRQSWNMTDENKQGMILNKSDFVGSNCVMFIVLLELCFLLELFTSVTSIVKTWSVSVLNLVRASYFDIHSYQLIMHKVVPYAGRKGRWWEELGIWEGWREDITWVDITCLRPLNYDLETVKQLSKQWYTLFAVQDK